MQKALRETVAYTASPPSAGPAQAAHPPVDAPPKSDGSQAARSVQAAVTHALAALRGNAYGLAVGTLGLFIGIVLWHLATTHSVDFYVNFANVPPPVQVLDALIRHLQDLRFYVHIQVSVQRIATGFLLATLLGVLLGTLMGRSRLGRALFYPYIEVLRPIPAVAWIPLAILMWPTDEASIVYITFLGALFPIVINTMHGVEQAPEVLVRAAKSLGASRMQIFWHVIFPSALPSITTGLAVGMGVSWFSLLAGEIISGQYGIGYFTWNAYSLINYPDIIVGMLVTGALGTISTYLVRLGARPLLKWQRKAR
ncbi:ABC transporter permease [Lutibaculum baratangense]|uniref:Alkanesulfonates transport system permease protein n=1 Tax=Lutibaculum baratangense AMV1 TaxID=631454 RepID=V4TP18_9HYPH|nr:ABC transporter permease [Lutibaculum baratangense]ESR27423.1 Alkanesulfonates transport system permease protein [Lutibaculum baratangense AMV1]